MDRWLIDKLDAAMTWAQKRGVSLVAAHCWVMALVLFGHVGARIIDQDKAGVVFQGVVWGVALYSYLLWAQRSRDYRQNVRLAQRLNAEAIGLRDRERSARKIFCPLLMAMVVLFDLPMAIFDNVVVGALHAVGTTLVVLAVYLNTSTFLAGGLPRSRAVPNGVHADGR